MRTLRLEEKQQIVEDLHGRFAKASLVVLTEYKGLNVAEASDLRRRLRQAGADFKVAKNTLLARAAEGTPVEGVRVEFQGPGAVAIGYADPVAPAKILTQFADEGKKLKIRLAVLDGRRIGPEEVKALAELPSREVLLAQALAAMAAVPASFVRVLAGVPRSLLTVLQAIGEKKGAAGAPAAA